MMPHFYKDVGGWFKFRPAFHQILSLLPQKTPSTFVEIGLWLGRSTAYLGVEIVNQKKPVTVIAVDHFKGQPEITGWRAALVPESEHTFRRNIAPVADALGERFRLVVADSVQAAAGVQDGSVDVVWLDAAHDYDGVRRDIEAWWPKLKLGGFMGGDDFIKCEGVKQAVEERFGRSSAAGGPLHWWLLRRLSDRVEFLA
jgi:predicted O-methyltransferase YrrM